MQNKIFSVSELNEYVKSTFDENPVLRTVSVQGEISNYKKNSSGHCYFTLKDQSAALSCALFRFDAQKLKFRPENGMKVTAVGRITLYVPSGNYQLVVSNLSASGQGDLFFAFEQLKKKLYSEGLFDTQYKKTLPEYPSRVVLITSGTGAAVLDMIRILRKRWPVAEVKLIPVHVQGDEAPGELVEAIALANELGLGDVIIVGRGGGSIEDLWAFNDERVARAIFSSVIPIVSAVGHEPDVTISDFVADCRASTPSNGAEIVSPDRQDMLQLLDNYRQRLDAAIDADLINIRSEINRAANSSVLCNPQLLIEKKQMELGYTESRLLTSLERTVSKEKKNFAALAASLQALNPLGVLARGYSITSDYRGNVIKSIKDTLPGDVISVRITDGTLKCEVLDKGEINNA